MPESYREKKELHQRHQLYLQLDSLKQSTAATLNNRAAIAALDSLLAKLDSTYITSVHDSLGFIRSLININSQKGTIKKEHGIIITNDKTRDVKIAVDDIDGLEEDSLLAKYNITKFWERLFIRQQIKLQKKGDNFLLYALGNTLWMMLVMMPLLALVLKLLYIRRGFFFFEHLVFSFHVHSFLFFLTTLLVLSSKWLGNAFEPILGISFFIISVYPFMAMKRFYKQGWFKTAIKYLVSNILYLFLFVGAFMGLAFASFALF